MMDQNQDSNYDLSMDPIGSGSKSSRGMDSSMPVASGTFSIATPAVTTILPMAENMNDSSFLLPMTAYIQSSLEKPLSSPSDISSKSSHQSEASISVNLHQSCPETGQQDVTQTAKLTDEKDTKPILSQSTPATDDHPETSNEDALKSPKKRTKGSKKSTKLDAKSKLEKSRQSARECRARKKLRYQYLEDLVCNREKAVVKLREEFSVFCELSKKIDVGTISESDRRLLTDQTKENSQNETTSLL